MRLFLILLATFIRVGHGMENVLPIQFSVSETKMVSEIPEKTRDFAFMNPRDSSTYIYDRESDYYQGYRSSYYALTCRKGGWDCLRHYEILMNGCIPYFIDLHKSPPNTMFFLPKDLILEAMNLPGVSCGQIDHRLFDKARYFAILDKMLKHTREYLTSSRIATYLLEAIHYSGKGSILFLSQDTAPDYLRCCTLIGLKEILGEKLVDVPKVDHIYKSYSGDVGALYGRGFTYTRVVEDAPVDRENLGERIKNREFEAVIYGSVHRGRPLLDLVQEVYEPEKVAFLCGEDQHETTKDRCIYLDWPNLFLREYEWK